MPYKNFSPPLATLKLRDRIIKDEIEMRIQSHDRHILIKIETFPAEQISLSNAINHLQNPSVHILRSVA